MNVNLGCGEFAPEGWVNIDLGANEWVHPTVIADVSKPLPFKRGSIDRLYAGHVLEHLDKTDALVALIDWKAYLSPQGTLLVVGPDVHLAYEMMLRKEIEPDEFTDIRFGARRWPGDEHRWKSTEQETVVLLQIAGWASQHADIWPLFTSGEWPIASGTGWQFALFCQRHTSHTWKKL